MEESGRVHEIALPLQDVFGDPEMGRVFSAEGTLAAWLEVERTLAAVQAAFGDIPQSAAEAIAREALPGRVDWSAVIDETRTVGYPILPLVQLLAESSSPEVGAFLHWGTTTQDIMDTGLMLQVRMGLDRVESLLERAGAAIAGLAVEHRSTVMAARTHAQQAVPTTFGAKLAVWLDEMRRHRDRLADLRPRLLVVQLFGAGGTAAALGPHSRQVRSGLARRLGLRPTDVPWHTARDSLAELGFVLAALASTAAKMAREVVSLSRTEISEVREASGHMRGASSTMPQKANPILSEAVIGMSGLASPLVPALLVAMQAEHERSAGEWQIEWDAIPTLFALTGGALLRIAEVLEGLQVFPERMRRNLDADGGMVMAEAAMMELAPLVGRAGAHDLVYRLCAQARDDGNDLTVALARGVAPDLLRSLPPLEEMLRPEAYIGEAKEIVDAAVAAWSDRTRAAAQPSVASPGGPE